MFRSSVAIIAMCSLFSTQLFSAPCASPFAGTAGQFQLVETLSCSAVTSPVRLDIVPQNSSAKVGYLTAECEKNSPYFDMYNSETIVAYSDTLATAVASLVRVSDTCDGAPIYLIDRHPTLYTLPSGIKVNTSIRVFAQDNAQTLIGYVAAADDTTDGLILRGSDQSVLASATKVFISKPDCKAVWTVINSGQTTQVAAVISFLLNLKDNPAVSCVAPTVCNTQGISQAGMFGIGLAVGTVFVGAVITAALCYIKHRVPQYARLIA